VSFASNFADTRARQTRPLGIVTSLFVAAVGIPMFFRLDGSLYRGAIDSEGVFLPLGLLTTPVFLFFQFPYIFSIRWTMLHSLVVLSVLYTLIVFFIGQFARASTGDLSLVVVYIAPLIVGVLLGSLLESKHKGEKSLTLISITLAVMAGTHAVTSVVVTGVFGTFLSHSRGADSIGELFTIHQRLNYVPLVMAYCFVWILFISKLRAGLKVLASASLLLDIVIDAAREPVVTIFVMVVLLALMWSVEGTKKSRWRRNAVLVSLSILSLMVILATKLFSDTYLFEKFVNIGGGNVDDLTGGRSEKIADFVARISEHPIFGEFMQITGDSRLTPHNQFMEAILRGGILFLIFLSAPVIWVIVVAVVRHRKTHRLEPVVQMGLILSVVFFLVNWNINTPLRSPFCMVFVGMVFGMVSVHRATWRRPPAHRVQGGPLHWSGNDAAAP